MMQKFSQVERRILSFPAVHPCEGVSPATLLDSLITLSQNISNYQSKFVATQRKNVRETIRQIGILLVFLEETRDSGLVVPELAVLCFSELHLTFQKIRFLLEDCSREGARLWILMKSEFIATQFRVLIRTVATALDVLPLNLIDSCAEVKELVELVAKQAWKANIDIDPDDERAMRRVLSVLNRFENGMEPEFQILKPVLDYLGIKSWSDCNKEISFLEEEISSQYVEGEEREVPLLSSLVGFMNYCRAVIFDALDNQSGDQTDVRCNMEILSCLEDFRCPISLELMIDPVTVSTGQTYDRSSIKKWFKAGNTICPKTGEKLTNTELVPNTSLRRLIHQFCADNGVSLAKTGKKSRDIARTILPGSQAAAEAMKCLSKFLARKLIFGPSEQKNKAAYEVRLLAKANIFNRSCLIEAGTVPPLLNLLYSFNKSIQENAIAALLKLSKHSSGKKLIVESGAGGLRSILAVLKRGMSLEVRQIAAATIFYLSSVKGHRKLIGEMPEAIPALVDLIKEGTPCGRKNAVVALYGLLLYPGNHGRVLDAGTVPLLVDILATSDKNELVTDALAVLATLAESYDGTFAILRTSSLPLIAKILHYSSTSQAGKEHCVSILLSLCTNGGEEAIAVLAKDPSVMSSLYSLIVDGTTHAVKKARSLIKILHRFHETSTSGQDCQAFTHEQPVHAW